MINPGNQQDPQKSASCTAKSEKKNWLNPIAGILFCISSVLTGLSLRSPLMIGLFLMCIDVCRSFHLRKLSGSSAGQADQLPGKKPNQKPGSALLKRPGFLYILGLLIALAGIWLEQKRVLIAWLLRNLQHYYGRIFLCILVLGVIFEFLVIHFCQIKSTIRRVIYWINLLLQILGLLCSSLLFYTSSFYQAQEKGLQALQSTEVVEVKDLNKQAGWLFDGPGTENALIFYPGAKVDPAAYAPLMQEIAQNGTDVFLLEMPWNMAVFGMNDADSVIEDPQFDYESWYIGGHSLGAAMAASYAADHPELQGLFLLAGYSTKPLPEQMQVLSIYGSEDGVLNRNSLDKYASNLPDSAKTIVLEGGNHAGFADYGPQKGDREASISPASQQEESAKAFLNMVQNAS